jgi:hypothetical protein
MQTNKNKQTNKQKKKIKGKNFLDCPEEKWETFGLEWGVANSLFQIAQGVLKTDKKTQESKHTFAICSKLCNLAAKQIFKSDDEVLSFLAQFKLSPRAVDIFLEFNTKTLMDGKVYSDSYQ